MQTTRIYIVKNSRFNKKNSEKFVANFFFHGKRVKKVNICFLTRFHRNYLEI